MSDEDNGELEYERAKKEFLEAMTELEILSLKKDQTPPLCSFCGRGKGQYLRVIEGKDGARICNHCVFVVYDKIVNNPGEKHE